MDRAGDRNGSSAEPTTEFGLEWVEAARKAGALSQARTLAPGLAVLAAVAVAATVLASLSDSLSPLVLSVTLAAVAGNCVTLPARCGAGIDFGARTLLRAGVVLLGLRLSLNDLASLGSGGLIGVAAVVACTFVGARLLARVLGVSKDLGLLLAAGYAICGASAIAAMNGVVDADEEETAYAIALVTLCGSLSILVLPFLGDLFSMEPKQFGAWAGASVHDVGQVVATASRAGAEALEQATLVKLTRVVLLAPIVAAVSLRYRSSAVTAGRVHTSRPLVPAFVVGFLAALLIRSTGILSDDVTDAAVQLEKLLLTLALAGLGFGVRLSRLRMLGGRPLLLGLSAWVLVAAVAYALTQLVTTH